MRGESEPGRRCARCRETKPVEEFAMRRRKEGQLDTYCRPCRSEYGKEHYAANRQRYIDQTAVRKRSAARERTLYILEFFKRHPCSDCGETDPLVLEFDHTGEKEFNIAYGFSHMAWQRVLDEIARCDVVCANCHRRRTARRAGFLRVVLSQRAPDEAPD